MSYKIGNILNGGKVVVVTERFVILDDNTTRYKLGHKALSGVPLDKDNIKDLGFVQNPKDPVHFVKDGRSIVYLYSESAEDIGWWYNRADHGYYSHKLKKLKYVHELQNIHDELKEEG